MTEPVSYTNIGTQTPLPRTSLSFSALMKNGINVDFAPGYDWIDDEIRKNDFKIQEQKNLLATVDDQLSPKKDSNPQSVFRNGSIPSLSLNDQTEIISNSDTTYNSDDEDSLNVNFRIV